MTKGTEKHLMSRLFGLIAICLLGTGLFAGTAHATEGIEAFKSTIVEAHEPPNPVFGTVVGEGIVHTLPSGEAFTIETNDLEGEIVTVKVSEETTYDSPGITHPDLGDVSSAAFIEAYGTISGSPGSKEIAATHVTIVKPMAGGHPDVETSFKLSNPGQPEAARNIIFNTPEGVFGNPEAVLQCTSLDFALQQCPSSSQVGLITIHANYKGDPNYKLGTAPIFAMDVPDDQTATFAFIVPTLDIPINIPVTVRTSTDYGLRFTVSNMTQQAPLAFAHLIFWGYPAASVHDSERFQKGEPGKPAGCVGSDTAGCIGEEVESPLSVQPLIDNPTICNGKPLISTIEVQTYQDLSHLSRADAAYPLIGGCLNEVFKPVLNARPTSDETDSASGLDLELSNQQFLGFANAPAQLRTAVVTLAEGLTVNPDAADGQTACTDAEANFNSEGPQHCPDNAKIGTVSIHTVALPEPLEGSIYIGEPKPGDQYRIILTADGFGIHSKIVGSVRPDPQTGRVTIAFADLPQVPFDDYNVHLFSSDRGLMATPISCGVYNTEAEYIAWNAALPEVFSNQIFKVDTGPHASTCPGQVRSFHPRLEAGASSSVAGAFSAFKLKLERDDGDQFLRDLNFRMPPGFTGSLRGIAYCPESSILAAAQNSGRAEQAAPSCPAASQIGTTNVAAGPGSHPFHAYGNMYLSGPFKGAPLSLAAITPALAGPYDYGVVVVRVALHVDPETAQVSAASDTVPSIIGGIPIRMRSIQVNIDRPNFTINPTNCAPLSVDSQGIGDQGTIADFSSPFHADNCATLGFGPRMTIRQVGGKKATRRSANPALQIDLRTRPGDANLKSLSVTLPKAFEIDQRHLGNICSEKELAEDQCAGRAPIGTATTTTPLLDQPLTGPVYAVSGSGGLPRLAFILNGQVSLIPRADEQDRQRPAEDHRSGDPRRPGRPLLAEDLRWQSRLPDEHAEPLQPAARSRDRIQRPERQVDEADAEAEDRVREGCHRRKRHRSAPFSSITWAG